jgi:hypothetical protein
MRALSEDELPTSMDAWRGCGCAKGTTTSPPNPERSRGADTREPSSVLHRALIPAWTRSPPLPTRSRQPQDAETDERRPGGEGQGKTEGAEEEGGNHAATPARMCWRSWWPMSSVYAGGMASRISSQVIQSMPMTSRASSIDLAARIRLLPL